MSTPTRIAFHASQKPRAQKALEEMTGLYGNCAADEADVIVVLGGDGSMLHALHQNVKYKKPLYGMNCGTLGFLMNPYETQDLPERIGKADPFAIHPLEMKAKDKNGKIFDEIAFNEVSLIRETHNSAKIKITVDGHERLEQMVCDGVLVCTAVGSTAYNSSAGGPILPLSSNMLSMTPISVFRPRRWPGALISKDAEIVFDIQRAPERPVSATADSHEVRDVVQVRVREAKDISCTLLFDTENHLAERIYAEQFAYGEK